MKDFIKSFAVLLMIGVTGFSALFTGLFSLGTILSWNTTDIGSKIAMFVFIVIFVFLLGLTGMLLEKYPHASKSSKQVKDMTGLEFEHYCAELLMKKGFKKVVVTPPSGDYGADLVAFDEAGNRWVFQCKHFNGKVGNNAVQEVVAAKAHYKADKGAVMTNSRLTEKARELAVENEILLFEMLSD